MLVSVLHLVHLDDARRDIEEIGESDLLEIRGAGRINASLYPLHSDIRELILESGEAHRDDELRRAEGAIRASLQALARGIGILENGTRRGIGRADAGEKPGERVALETVLALRDQLPPYCEEVERFVRQVPARGSDWASEAFENRLEPRSMTMERIVSTLVRESLVEIEEEIDETRSTVADIRRNGILASAAGFLLALPLGVAFSRRLTRPIVRLGKAMDRVRNGDMEVRLDPCRGNDEIAAVTRTFNQMVAELRSKTASIEDLNREIVARKEMEEALREREHQYRLLIENAADAILIVQNEVVHFANTRAFGMFGYEGRPFPEAIGGMIHHGGPHHGPQPAQAAAGRRIGGVRLRLPHAPPQRTHPLGPGQRGVDGMEGSPGGSHDPAGHHPAEDARGKDPAFP